MSVMKTKAPTQSSAHTTPTCVIPSTLISVLVQPRVSQAPVFQALDRIILTIFTVEAGLKMCTFGLYPWKFFFCNGAVSYWNIFDFFIVVASYAMDHSAAVLLRLLRLLRVLKLVRVCIYFPSASAGCGI